MLVGGLEVPNPNINPVYKQSSKTISSFEENKPYYSDVHLFLLTKIKMIYPKIDIRNHLNDIKAGLKI